MYSLAIDFRGYAPWKIKDNDLKLYIEQGNNEPHRYPKPPYLMQLPDKYFNDWNWLPFIHSVTSSYDDHF